MRGLFITFEGGEGSGKSTHSEKVYQALIKKSCPVILTHEPGGTHISDQIRELLLTREEDDKNSRGIVPNAELLLYLASRAQHVEELILPALNAGKIVLCDRFADATEAYQGYGRGLEIKILNLIGNFVSHNLVPDHTILLDIDPVVGLERSKRLKKNFSDEGEMDRMESQGLKFHRAVRRGYLEIAKANSDRVSVYDTSNSIEENGDMILKCILDLVESRAISGSHRPRKR